jgi:hypothetical protein
MFSSRRIRGRLFSTATILTIEQTVHVLIVDREMFFHSLDFIDENAFYQVSEKVTNEIGVEPNKITTTFKELDARFSNSPNVGQWSISNVTHALKLVDPFFDRAVLR